MKSRILHFMNKKGNESYTIGSESYVKTISKECASQIIRYLDLEHSTELRNDMMKLTSDQLVGVLAKTMNNKRDTFYMQ